MANWIEIVLIIISGAFCLVASTVTLVWFVAAQFSINRNLMHTSLKEVTKLILDKLEYHEQHDDIRFAELAKTDQQTSDRIWNIELRNAAKDGTLPHEYKKN